MERTELDDVVDLLAKAFATRKTPHVLIGGLAVGVRSRSRSTKDADFIIDSPALSLPGLLEDLAKDGFEIDLMNMLRSWPVDRFLVFYRGKARIDWLYPIIPLYNRVLKDATEYEWSPGYFIRVATSEGLILTKLLSYRPQDIVDIQTILSANITTINPDIVREEWQPLAHNFPDRTVWIEEQFAKYLPAN